MTGTILRVCVLLATGLLCAGFTVRGDHDLTGKLKVVTPLTPGLYGIVNFRAQALEGEFPLVRDGDGYAFGPQMRVTFYEMPPLAGEIRFAGQGAHLAALCEKDREPHCGYDLAYVNEGFVELVGLKPSARAEQLPDGLRTLLTRAPAERDGWQVKSADDLVAVMVGLRTPPAMALSQGIRLARWPVPLPRPRPRSG